MNTHSLQELIDFAIQEEIKADKLYTGLAARITDKGTCVMLKDMAAMEKGHAEKLKAFKSNKSAQPDLARPQNLMLAEYMVDKALTDDSGIQEVMLFAIQCEKKAAQMYSDLAAVCNDASARAFLAGMAAEELRHKNSLEKSYDDNVFQEN